MAEVINDMKLVEAMAWDDADDFVAEDEYAVDQSRWHVNTVSISKRKSDGKLFMINWSKAATEYQDHNFHSPAYECETYIEPVTKYRKVV